MPKTKLNGYDRFDKVQSMKKNTQNNNVTNRIGAIDAEIGIELS